MPQVKPFITTIAAGCILAGCSKSPSPPEPQENNNPPVYVDGLQSEYSALNGEIVVLDTANFSDADNDVLSIRYFTLDAQQQRTFVDSNQFTCDSSITAAGAVADDGEAQIDSDIVSVNCLLNNEQVAGYLVSNEQQTKTSHINHVTTWFEHADIDLTARVDQNGDGQFDTVVGIGHSCQQVDFDGFNAAPVMPAEAAAANLYDDYPQYLVCLERFRLEEDVVTAFVQAMENAPIADLLVMTDALDSNDPGTTLLHQVKVKQYQSGKQTLEQRLGGIRLLGADSAVSTVQCGDGNLSLSKVSQPLENHPRLTQFEIDKADLVTLDGGGVYTDCQMTNALGITAALAPQGSVAVEYENVTAKSELAFEPSDLNSIDNTSTMTAGLVDADDHNDVITVLQKDIYWYRNLENGSFAQRQKIAEAASHVKTIKMADIDGDRRQDIVWIDQTQLVYLRNLSDGVFELTASIEVAENTEHLTLVDVDGDGNNEILVSTESGSNGRQLVYYTLGQTGFSTATVLLDDTNRINQVGTGDVNSDGIDDLFVAGEDLYVLMGNPDGSIGDMQVIATERSPIHAVVADFDRNGINELVLNFDLSLVHYKLDDNLALLDGKILKEGEAYGGNFFHKNGFAQFHAISAGDYTDLLIVHHNRTSFGGHTDHQYHLRNWRFTADGEPVESETQVMSSIEHIVLSDFGVDARADILTLDGNQILNWRQLKNEVSLLEGPTIAGSSRVGRLEVADYDNNGIEDLLLFDARIDWSMTSWSKHLGQWSLLGQNAFGPVEGESIRSTLYDYDFDGDLDFLRFRKLDDKFVFDWHAHGPVGFNHSPEHLKNVIEGQFRFADLDGSGVADMYTFDTYKLTYYLNPGQEDSKKEIEGLFTEVLHGDLNGDGLEDFVTLGGSGDWKLFKVYLAGDGEHNLLQQDIGDNAVYKVEKNHKPALLDIDNDGDLDIVYAMTSKFKDENGYYTSAVAFNRNDGSGRMSDLKLLYQELSYDAEFFMADLTGNGAKELVIFRSTSRLNSDDQYYTAYLASIYNVTADGTVTVLHNQQGIEYLDSMPVAGIADFDSDGKDEFILLKSSNFLSDSAGVWGYDDERGLHQRKALTGVDAQNDIKLNSSTKLVDYDGDGDMDVVALDGGIVRVIENN